MKVLSIDWDYFMNCSAEERLKYFPDGGNEDLSFALSSHIWMSRYAQTQDFSIESIKVRNNDLDLLKRCIAHNKDRFYFACADSHKHLGEFLLHPDMDEKIRAGLEIVNIDHHHDCWQNGDKIDCGNWLYKVCKQFPDATVCWVSNEDSEECPLDTVDRISLEDAASRDYDVVYLCRSGQWSCPHLDKEFGALSRYIYKRCVGSFLREEVPNRWGTESIQYIKKLKEMYSQVNEG